MKGKNIPKKNGFTIIEVSMVFLLIFAVTFLVLPRSLDNTIQAKLISQWTQKYSEIEYTFSVIKAQQNGLIVNKVFTTENNHNAVLSTMKTYFRISSRAGKDYIPLFRNKMPSNNDKIYGFKDYYNTTSNEVLGLKWINKNCTENQICAMMSIDINGEKSPNIWGRDIYGVNIYKDKIEPIGKNILEDTVKYDCGKNGTGVYCSYYYLMGGKFD